VDQYSGVIFPLVNEDWDCSVHLIYCSDISQLPSELMQLTLLVEKDESNYIQLENCMYYAQALTHPQQKE
jgi:hypothetical protein